MVPLLPEPQLDVDESTSPTVETVLSSVEVSTPASALVAADALIPLDAIEPIVGETAGIVKEMDVAPALIDS